MLFITGHVLSLILIIVKELEIGYRKISGKVWPFTPANFSS